MRIVAIFAPALYAFCLAEGDDRNALEIAMDHWNDIDWLKSFAEANDEPDVGAFVEHRLDEARRLDAWIDEVARGHGSFEALFRPLRDEEIEPKLFAPRKAKLGHQRGIPRCALRLYAVRIDQNVFAITGGAIKMSQAMQDHPNTMQALHDLNRARSYLQGEGIVNQAGFLELMGP